MNDDDDDRYHTIYLYNKLVLTIKTSADSMKLQCRRPPSTWEAFSLTSNQSSSSILSTISTTSCTQFLLLNIIAILWKTKTCRNSTQASLAFHETPSLTYKRKPFNLTI